MLDILNKFIPDSLAHKSIGEIMLDNNKDYQKYKEQMSDGTYKAGELQKTSEMAKRCERVTNYNDKYINIGKILMIITFIHIIIITVCIFTGDFILYFLTATGLAMMWYALYKKKTPFAYTAPVAVVMGIVIDIALRYVTILLFWGIIIAAVLAALSFQVHLLNNEYVYLSKQEGFPHFKRILDDEIEKNKKALAGEINRHYAELTLPEDEQGVMEDLEMTSDSINARPDGRNDLMDSL